MMVPEHRLYPWDTVVRCGSKDTSVPNSLHKLSAYCGAPIRESTKTTVHKCVLVGNPRNDYL